MRQLAQNILKQHWGYSSFRPMQEDIIISVLEGKDTLALLPTGGGKSICFQVPALALDGICLVVTPLVALMKDQVNNLLKKNIKAAAIYSGMSANEINHIIDKSIKNEIKFLYVSPERLQTNSFIMNMQQMNVGLIAVDEAHCISQWGYDFRPPYLQIASIRKYMPKTPVLALTATATPEVVIDIQDKLDFKKHNLYQKSFERDNLVYTVFKEEAKLERLIRICKNVKGTGIVYVRNRKKTAEISDFLNKKGISADFYHAGLDLKTRERKQEDWIEEKIRIIVSTNAFGMGIDKPNVRFVVHMDIPNNIEAYFQEAGRGGRDGEKAYAALLYDEKDISDLYSNHQKSYPDIEYIKRVYKALCNHKKIPLGGGKECTYEYDLVDFSNQYNFSPLLAYNSLKALERENLLLLIDNPYMQSKIHFKVNSNELRTFRMENKNWEQILVLLLRNYGGLFSDYKNINEGLLANQMKISTKRIANGLHKLKELDILDYIEQTKKPCFYLCSERLNEKHIKKSKLSATLEAKALFRIKEMEKFIVTDNKCRSKMLLEYFGEKNATECGKCDFCINRNSDNINNNQYENIKKDITQLLKNKAISLDKINNTLVQYPSDILAKVIQELIDSKHISEKNGLFNLVSR